MTSELPAKTPQFTDRQALVLHPGRWRVLGVLMAGFGAAAAQAAVVFSTYTPGTSSANSLAVNAYRSFNAGGTWSPADGWAVLFRPAYDLDLYSVILPVSATKTTGWMFEVREWTTFANNLASSGNNYYVADVNVPQVAVGAADGISSVKEDQTWVFGNELSSPRLMAGRDYLFSLHHVKQPNSNSTLQTLRWYLPDTSVTPEVLGYNFYVYDDFLRQTYITYQEAQSTSVLPGIVINGTYIPEPASIGAWGSAACLLAAFGMRRGRKA